MLCVLALVAIGLGAHDAQLRAVLKSSQAADPCAKAPCGDPLFLSDLIARNPQRARTLSRVVGLKGFEDSHSGLITAASSNNSLFVWYIPPPKLAPCIVWLQGGPGAPSTYGLFTEIGPVIVGAGGELFLRNQTWSSKYGLLIVDNPAGVGFSKLGDPRIPVRTEEQVGRELVEVLQQFVNLIPEVRAPSAGLYIAGESYGGKYAPAAAATAVSVNRAARRAGQAERLPLRGLIIGDGWCDPESHVPAYPSMLMGMGLLDTAQHEQMRHALARSSALLATGDLVGAFDGWDSVWGDYGGDYPGKSWSGKTLFENVTGGSNTENVWYSHGDPNIPSYAAAAAWMQTPTVRRAIHIGNLTMGTAGVDQYHVMIVSGDFMNSSKADIESVLQAGVPVLAYNGAWDGVVGAAVSEPLYAKLKWEGSAEFRATARQPWKVLQSDSQVAGLVSDITSADGSRFVRAVVRSAGHIVPADQPAAAFDLIDRFITRRGWGE